MEGIVAVLGEVLYFLDVSSLENLKCWIADCSGAGAGPGRADNKNNINDSHFARLL